LRRDRGAAIGCRAALVVTILLASISASAQPSPAERAQAEALFNEGKKLLKDGSVPEACRKFEGSYRIDPAGGTVLNLGLCHEKEGKIAAAWGELKEALAAAKKANRKDREKIARERIDAIEPRLPYMIVIPEQPAAGLVITIDGSALASEAWGAQIPIDPGKHAIKATAEGREAWEGPFEAVEGKKVTVRVPTLSVAKIAPSSSGSATSAPVVMVPKYPWMRPSGIAIASLGLAALGVGAAFGAIALTQSNKVASECGADLGCSKEGLDAVQSGRTSALAADVLLGAGAGFAALGVAFFLVGGSTQPAPVLGAARRSTIDLGAPGSSARRPTLRVSPVARASGSGAFFGLEGAW